MIKKRNDKIKLIIFDLDGTALDTDLYVVLNHVHLCEKYLDGKIFPLSTLIQFSGPALADTFDEYYPNIDKKALTDDFRDFSLKYTCKYSRLYDHEIEVLEKLKEAGYYLAILTTKKKEPTGIVLHHFGLDKYFSMAVSLEDVNKIKPDPEGVYKIMEHFKVNSDEVAIIGDSLTDYLAGKNANIMTLFTTWGLKKVPENIQPDYFVNTYKDIEEVFLDEWKECN